jgi:two-component system chemotaxis response regulator CheY
MPDQSSITRILTRHFDVEVLTADKSDDALAALRSGPIDLVLVNRKLDCDYSDGLEIIRQIKADAELKATPCMLVSNYAEHQETAVAAGAERGFGKSHLENAETQDRLKGFLDAQ